MRPILFKIFGSPVYSYPLMMGMGWGVGYNVARSYWERDKLPVASLNRFFALNFLMAWIGAKVFFLIFSAPNRGLEYSKEINFWLGGGFVFYGGLVFCLVTSFGFLYFDKSITAKSLGLLTPAVCLGHAVGRIGCFLAGCCYGNQCDLPFVAAITGHPRHPVQLYEAMGLFALYFLLRKVLEKGDGHIRASITYLYGYSCLRFCLEFLRGDGVRGHHFGLSTSQWVSIILVLISLIISFKQKTLKILK